MTVGNLRRFDWTLCIGEPLLCRGDVHDYLHMLQGLFKEDRLFLGLTAPAHTCAIDDPYVYLDHARRSGLLTSPDDFRLWDAAYAYVQDSHPTFYSDKEVERRMRDCNDYGTCPMCGHRPRFKCSDTERLDCSDMISQCETGCCHLRRRTINGHLGGALRKPETWMGKHWPFDAMTGEAYYDPKGYPKNIFPAKCSGCAEMHQHRKMELALAKLIQDGWNWDKTDNSMSSAVSHFCCKWRDCENSGGITCDHSYMLVKLAMQKARFVTSGHTELRLDDAGVKLIIEPARADHSVPGVIRSRMYVTGDLVKKYPGFAEHAHRLFAEMGIPTVG